MKNFKRWNRLLAGAGMLGLLVLAAFPEPVDAATPIKIGVIKVPNGGPVYIAQERGYFAAEGVPAELVFFDSSQPIAVAVVSGDLDFGVTGLTAGFYGLASQGALRIVAAQAREVPGFENQGYLVSAHAYEAGLKTPKDIAGRVIALSQIGAPQHYALGLLAEKYGFDLKASRLLPMQSIPNMISAVAGGQADVTVVSRTPAIAPLVQRGQAKMVGWVGNETPWQFGAAFTATKIAQDKGDVVAGFLRAYRKGARDYHDAFTGADGRRKDGAAAPEILAIVAKYTGLQVEQASLGITAMDAEARLDAKDVQHQIAWYSAQGLLKGQVDASTLIDKRYAVTLP